MVWPKRTFAIKTRPLSLFFDSDWEVKAMTLTNQVEASRKGQKKTIRGKAIFTVAVLSVFCLVFSSCQQTQKAQEEAVAPQINEFTGKVKTAWGKYLYLPAAQGFDILVEGNLDSGALTDLIDKEIRVRGNMMKEEPSLFIADTIEIKEGENQWRTVFTRTTDPQLTDFFHPGDRDSYQELKVTGINKPEEWEGKGKGKVYGQLVMGEGKEGAKIAIFDARGKELARIIVDNITDYAFYYTKKLRLYDKFWFYLNIKETVDRSTRLKTREIFHADVIFAGIY